VSAGLRVVHGLLLPGKVIGDGRYRLLQRSGTDERHKAQLWQACDGQSKQDVALTILTGDPENAGAMRRARRSLGRAAHPVSLAHPGIAPVVNVVSVGDGVPRDEGVLGMVAAEWTPGRDLADLVARGPVAPAEACRLLEPLAEAVGQAHRDGLVLGVGHPQRIRVTDDGLRLAFPGPPDRRPRDDVRGLGALLYLLLTGRSPGFRRPRALAAPSEVRPEVPAELSELAVRSLDESTQGSIRTSDTILQVLRRMSRNAERTQRIRPISDGQVIWTTKPPVVDPVRRKRLTIGVAVLLVMSLAAVVWIGATVAGLFAGDDGASQGPSAAVTPPAPQNAAQVPANRIAPAGVAAFSPQGAADSADAAPRAIDGDPATTWQTTAYAAQLPAAKPGIGLAVSFPRPMRPAHVVIDSPSAGTVVEIRAADSAKPNLADTTLLGTVTLSAGSTSIELRSTVPVQHVIVWLTRLSETGGSFQSAIGEISFAE
jgi:hypothetical protein